LTFAFPVTKYYQKFPRNRFRFIPRNGVPDNAAHMCGLIIGIVGFGHRRRSKFEWISIHFNAHRCMLCKMRAIHAHDMTLTVCEQGCSGAGTRGGRPHFFRQGRRAPHSPHFFGLKFVQKLVHCCNWLLTETQCKIISVQQN